MPLLDSFKVDHTIMQAPGVRLAKVMKTPHNDEISVFDLRFCKPNKEILDEKGIHTMEHLFAGFMRDHLNSTVCEIIDISPMGCRTGFYMSVIGKPSCEQVIKAWTASMNDILSFSDDDNLPEANQYQCGTYKMHSLQNAKIIAADVLKKGVSVIDNEKIKLDLSKF